MKYMDNGGKESEENAERNDGEILHHLQFLE